MAQRLLQQRFIPTGDIAADTVQAALAEVDAEKLAKTQNLADLADKATARDNLGAVSISGPTQTITGNKIFNALIRANGNIDSFVGAVNINRIDMGLATNGPRIIFENTNNVWFNDCTAAGTIRWATPGNERVTISSVGNMGIGITGGAAANAKLQVAGGVAISSSTAAATDPGAGNLSTSGDVFTNNLRFRNNAGGNSELVNNGGGIDFNVIPAVSTSEAYLRLFRSTNTTTNTYFDVLIGNNTATANCRLSGRGISFLNANNSNLGIGTTTPGAKLQIAGGMAITSSAGAAADPGSGNLSVSGDTTTSNIYLRRSAGGGATDILNNGNFIDINVVPTATTTEAFLRLFRNTNNTANNYLDVLIGNNTAASNCRLSGRGNSWLNVDNNNVGVGTSTPGAKLQVAGGVVIASNGVAATDPGAGNLRVTGQTATSGLKVGARTVTTNTTITTAGCLIFIDASANPIDLLLPTAVGNLGVILTLIRTDNSANTVRVLTSPATQTINGSATITIPGNSSLNLSSNDINWFIF